MHAFSVNSATREYKKKEKKIICSNKKLILYKDEIVSLIFFRLALRVRLQYFTACLIFLSLQVHRNPRFIMDARVSADSPRRRTAHVLVSPLTLTSVRITLHLHSVLLLSLRLIKNDNELGKGQHVPFYVLLAWSPLLPPLVSLSLSLSLLY